MSVTQIISAKEIAEEYANTVWNGKEMRIIDTLVHENVLIHSTLGDYRGSQFMKDVVFAWLNGFPDLSVTNDLIFSENDLVSIQWTANGTHKGKFKDKSPTGKSISYKGITIYRIKNGQIIEYWAYVNMEHVMNQIA